MKVSSNGLHEDRVPIRRRLAVTAITTDPRKTAQPWAFTATGNRWELMRPLISTRSWVECRVTQKGWTAVLLRQTIVRKEHTETLGA